MRGPGWLRRGGRVTGETARRITGVSSPLGGVQWSDPGPPQRELVRRFLVELEDRRVLYNPMQLEVRSQADQSIHGIREACTKTLQHLGERDFAVLPVQAIRQACRRYHDEVGLEFRFFDHHARDPEGSPSFFMALGGFRMTVGYQVALLAGHYDIDVEGDLASVLPDEAEDTP